MMGNQRMLMHQPLKCVLTTQVETVCLVIIGQRDHTPRVVVDFVVAGDIGADESGHALHGRFDKTIELLEVEDRFEGGVDFCPITIG